MVMQQRYKIKKEQQLHILNTRIKIYYFHCLCMRTFYCTHIFYQIMYVFLCSVLSLTDCQGPCGGAYGTHSLCVELSARGACSTAGVLLRRRALPVLLPTAGDGSSCPLHCDHLRHRSLGPRLSACCAPHTQPCQVQVFR